MPAPPHPAPAVIWYRRLIRLYPARFQQAYGSQLTQLFQDIYRDSSTQTASIRRRALAHAFSDTISNIAYEQFTNLKEHLMKKPSPSANLPRRRLIKLRTVIIWIIGLAVAIPLLQTYVFQPYKMVGSSMSPHFEDSNHLIISKLPYASLTDSHIPSRGQVIVFRYPKEPRVIFIKRVVGLPGDRVVIKDGAVTIYNQQNPGGFNPDKAYAPGAKTLIDSDHVVHSGQVFVLGDNRAANASYDSREWGDLPAENIIGDVILRLPF